MNRFKYFLLILITCAIEAFAAEHTTKGTSYGESGIHVYAQMRHGPDGALFLDPYFIPYLRNLDGKVLVDVGCGAGPWSIVAAQNGAQVYGIDIQSGMIEKAKAAAKEAGVENATQFSIGDVAELPFPDAFCDQAISINVGCNLPKLEPHIKELKRVLKKEGLAVITAPISFGTLFTSDNQSNAVLKASIAQALQEAEPLKSLQGLNDVYRATFIEKEGAWILIEDESAVESGDKIWRKIPKMVVPNHYHAENEYVTLFQQEGFRIKAIYRPKFASREDQKAYNLNHAETLGEAYVTKSPFVIFVIQKVS